MRLAIRVIFFAVMASLSSLSIGDESVADRATEHPAQKNLPQMVHFGNMGGLLPTLSSSDLPESGSDEALMLEHFCSQCHNAPGPGLHTVKEWQHIYWKMFWRMVVTNASVANFNLPSYPQSQALFQYLLRNANKSIKDYTGPVIEKTSPGSKAFHRVCQQCHVLPSPDQHNIDGWRATVMRMQANIVSMNRYQPSDEEVEMIIEFLGRYAAKEEPVRQ
jgi:hypothetical protein